MASVAPELVVESALLLGYVLVAALLTVFGLGAEYLSVQYYSAGELSVALWFGAMGALMLYAGVYAVGYQQVLRRDSA